MNFEESKASLNPKDLIVHVDRVIVNGVGRTKTHVVKESVMNILKAKNFLEMLILSQTAKHHMEKLGLFKSVQITIDSSKSENPTKDGFDVNFDVVEQRPITGQANTLVGTNDVSLMLSANFPNLCGRGERLNGEYCHGTRNTRGANLHFCKPFTSNPDIMFSLNASQNHGDYPWSAYKQTDRSLSADFRFPSIVGVHTFKWEGVWRCLNSFPSATFAVTENSGHSVKSSLSHSVSRDSRDNEVLPNTGSLIRFYQEYAGLGGDVHFEKYQFQLQLNRLLPLNTVAQMTFDAGVISSHDKERQRVNDLFMLGGPLTLRGFSFNGIGPRADGHSLGGDRYWLSGVHLYTPLPFYPGRGGFGDLFRTHFFMTAGNLLNSHDGAEGSKSVSKTLNYLKNESRFSIGAGIVFLLGGIARLELNYVLPLRVHHNDSVCRGFQFGIGLWYS